MQHPVLVLPIFSTKLLTVKCQHDVEASVETLLNRAPTGAAQVYMFISNHSQLVSLDTAACIHKVCTQVCQLNQTAKSFGGLLH